MKAINSSVARTDLDRFFGSSPKARHVAQIKKIARKQERARLKVAANREMILVTLDQKAERAELARMEAEATYRALMARVMAKKLAKRERAASKRQRELDSAYIPEVYEERKTVSYFTNGEQVVLASCALA